MSTIKKIAEKTGYSASTVSYALRDNPRIPEETRIHIKKAASELGYQRDAQLGQLMSYLKGRGQKTSFFPVAWINSTPDPDFWKNTPWAKEFYESAQNACKRLGLMLTDVWVHDPKTTNSRLNDILKTRGTKGLLLSTPLKNQEWIQWIDWNAYATVIIDDPFAIPQFDRVFAQYNWNIRVAIEKAINRGYRRPKLWMTEQEDYWTGYGYSQECLRQASIRSDIENILTPLPSDLNTSTISNWLNAHNPDVIISTTPTLGKKLKEMGYSFPDDFGYISMYVPNENEEWTGMNQLHMQQSIVAIDRIATLIQSNTIGRQNYPQQIQIRGEWHEGSTLKAPTHSPVYFER